MADKQTITIPDLKAILATGLQFGHSTSKWNPLMRKYIYDAKNGIHVIDVLQTQELLGKAVQFIAEAAGQGDIVFVGTKRQAATIVKEQAVAAGAHFVVNRWPGGLLTNFKMSKRSLDRLLELERLFEEGVEGRTKYEVAKMKVEWERLDRLYGGIKTLTAKPAAVVIIDPRYEKVVVRECRRVNVPVIALADTNCDPTVIDYLIPGNDDALGSIGMVMEALATAVKAGNGGKGVVHNMKDYSAAEVKLIKQAEEQEEVVEVDTQMSDMPAAIEKISTQKKSGPIASGKGILERVKEQAAEPKKEEKPKAKAVKPKSEKAEPAKAAKPKAASKKPAAKKK